MKNIQIIFNFSGDIQLVKDEFNNITLIKIPEMIDGSYLCLVDNADDFDLFDEFMNAIGNIVVISGFYQNGKQYQAKKTKNKYTKTKYKKYLRDKFTLDEDGNKIKITKTAWQVMKIAGWNDREL